MGDFSQGNGEVGVDFAREEKPKLAVGVAWSYNDGASNAVGEGHGDFSFFDENGKSKHPSLRKLSADLLFKWQGFTLMGEYINSTATSLKGSYTSAAADMPLLPGEIAGYLALGDGYNFQAGYFFRQGWGIDARFSRVKPEFKDVSPSILTETNEFGVALTKYFIDNRFMCQGYFSYLKNPKLETGNERINAEISLKLIF